MKQRYKDTKIQVHPDLTRIEDGRSVGRRLEVLVQTCNIYRNNPKELKNEIQKILNDPTTIVSPEKKMEYEEINKRYLIV